MASFSPTSAATGRIHGATGSLIDYNCAGVPLIETSPNPSWAPVPPGRRRSPGPM